jgi:predicted secreted Zn-dependent protease
MAVAGLIRQLRWDDYRKVATSEDGKHDAVTGIDIRHQCRFLGQAGGRWRTTQVSVSVEFNATKSWVVEGKTTDELLKHEQTHYDIAAIAARQLEERLKGLTGNASKRPEVAIAEIVRQTVGEQDANGNIIYRGVLQEVQDRYDEDLTCGSKHGAERNQQVRWEHRVNRTFTDAAGLLGGLNMCAEPEPVAAE